MARLMLIGVETKLITETCCNCGMMFAIPVDLQRKFSEKHTIFYCPNGHGQSYTGETDAERFKRLYLEESAENTRQKRVRLQLENDLLAMAREKKRIERRAKAGVCQECHRTFQNVQRHMVTKHEKGA